MRVLHSDRKKEQAEETFRSIPGQLSRDPDSRAQGRAQRTQVSKTPQVTILYSLD